MAKIKLTESQIKMLQNLGNLPKRKVVKITTEQYNRIFESNEGGFEGISQAKSLQPATKMTQNFKNSNKGNPSANFKFENEMFGENMDGQTFGKGIINYLKDLVVNPSDEPNCEICKDLGVTNKELLEKMMSLGMVTYGMVGERKILQIKKDGIEANIKELFDTYVGEPVKQEVVQFGNDIEMGESDEAGSDMKKALSEPFRKKQGQAMSQEMINKKLADIRAKELSRRKSQGEPTVKEEQPVTQMRGGSFDLKLWNDWYAIFEKGGEYLLFCVDCVSKEDYLQHMSRPETYHGKDEDGMPDIEYGDADLTDEAIESLVNQNFGDSDIGNGLQDWENGSELVKLDQPLIDELKTSIKYFKNPNQRMAWGKFLSSLTLGETTIAAGSSGAFVGPMSGGASKPIHRGISPEKSMKNISLKETLGEDLKYNNIMHPKLGKFIIQDILSKREEGTRISYIITLLNDGGGESESSLLYIYDMESGEEELLFNHEFEKLYDTYELFDDVYKLVFDAIKEKLRPTDGGIDEQGIGNSGEYATLGFASSEFMGTKGKKGKAPVNKGVTHKNTMYPKGEFVGEDEKPNPRQLKNPTDAPASVDRRPRPTQLKNPTDAPASVDRRPRPAPMGNPIDKVTKAIGGSPRPAPMDNPIDSPAPARRGLKPNPSSLSNPIDEDNQSQTAYPRGEFVKLDDCTKLNNNKVAQNGGCSTGAIDNVVKTKKSKGSVVSKDAVYYEVAKKTGRTIAEVKKLVGGKK